ncbi:GH25 family lysozyme [Hydrogeniiclostridium mannosilyticum]|uniref:GH25 family lysozyme n=1 Tax=Hydrogeniiclostridium mannosilyticum TaxID=2764322 RepID=UPI00399C300B
MGREMLSIRAIKAVAGCLAGILLTLPTAGLSSLSSSAEETFSTVFSDVVLSHESSAPSSTPSSSDTSSGIASAESVLSTSEVSSAPAENDYKKIEIKSETQVAGKNSATAQKEDPMNHKNNMGSGGVNDDSNRQPEGSSPSSGSSSSSSSSVPLPPSPSEEEDGTLSPLPPQEIISTRLVYGIDISYYNRVTNWKAVKDSGIEFVMIRVGYRGYGTGVLVLDDQFENNIKGAKAAGLKVGAYFFSQALNEAEAREEAAFMLKYLSKYSLDFPVAYDMENFDPNYRTYSLNGNRTQITNNAIAFCEVVKNAGYTPMVYYGSGNLNNFDTNLLSSRYKIWFARYPSYWDENTKLNYNGHYDIWQYTSEGSVPGIAGNVDKNVMYVDTVTYRYYLTYHANGGVNAPVHSTAYDKGASVSVAGPGSMSREGYTFTGWNTKPDGSGTKYAAGSTYTNITGSVILYAQWQKLEQVGILYDANGGQNAPVDAKHYYAGGSVPVLDAGNMNREGYVFIGWNTKPDGSGAFYAPGSNIQGMKTSLTLYAQWKKIAPSGGQPE